MKPTSRELRWKCNLPQLLEEILINNQSMGIFKIPINLTKGILCEVAERAIQLNDPILNELMCDLALYELPYRTSNKYRSMIKKVRAASQKQRLKEKTQQQK